MKTQRVREDEAVAEAESVMSICGYVQVKTTQRVREDEAVAEAESVMSVEDSLSETASDNFHCTLHSLLAIISFLIKTCKAMRSNDQLLNIWS